MASLPYKGGIDSVRETTRKLQEDTEALERHLTELKKTKVEDTHWDENTWQSAHKESPLVARRKVVPPQKSSQSLRKPKIPRGDGSGNNKEIFGSSGKDKLGNDLDLLCIDATKKAPMSEVLLKHPTTQNKPPSAGNMVPNVNKSAGIQGETQENRSTSFHRLSSSGSRSRNSLNPSKSRPPSQAGNIFHDPLPAIGMSVSSPSRSSEGSRDDKKFKMDMVTNQPKTVNKDVGIGDDISISNNNNIENPSHNDTYNTESQPSHSALMWTPPPGLLGDRSSITERPASREVCVGPDAPVNRSNSIETHTQDILDNKKDVEVGSNITKTASAADNNTTASIGSDSLAPTGNASYFDIIMNYVVLKESKQFVPQVEEDVAKLKRELEDLDKENIELTQKLQEKEKGLKTIEEEEEESKEGQVEEKKSE